MLKSVVGPILRPIVRSIFDGFGSRPSPSLSLNFVTTSSLDPRITFSRTTNATVTGSNGLIQNAPMNLLTFSEQFDNAAWQKSGINIIANSVVAPNGTQTADTLDATTGFNAVLNAGGTTVASSTTYTFSFYALRGTATALTYSVRDRTNSVDIIASVNYYSQTSSSAWARISVTFTTPATCTSVFVYPLRDSLSTGTVFLWGAQLELGSTTTTYNPTTVKNLLGFTENFDNAAWTKSNAFVQTNLLTYSQDFDVSSGAWGKNSSTVSSNTTVAPDGTTTADTITLSAGTAQKGVQRSIFGGAIPYTFSVYAKAGTQSIIQLSFNWVATYYANFDLSTGTLGTVGATVTASITSVGDGWYRCSITRTDVTGVNALYIEAVDATTSGYRATTASTGEFYLWGAQLVQGTSAGDYKATYAAAAAVGYTDIYGQPFAQKLVENSANNMHGTYLNSVIGDALVPLTVSVYAKAGERSWLFINFSGIADKYTYFNLATGVVGTNPAGSTATITPVGDGWYRCSVQRTNDATFTNYVFGSAIADNTSSYTGDGTSGIYIFGAQLSDSASVDPYVYNPVAAPTSTAYYGPRFDYDPVTLAPKGLLIEEQRVNLLLRSEELDNASWLKSASTVTANALVSPDGALDADKLVEDTSNGQHLIGQSSGTQAAGAFTFSFYVKAGERSRGECTVGSAVGAGSGFYASFNLNTQTATLMGQFGTGFTGTSASLTSAGNGWFRFQLSGTTSASSNVAVQINLYNNAGSIGYTGDGTSGLFIYGAQLEAGAFATSYIPTVASQVTRTADNASMIGNNFARWYTQGVGTLFADWGPCRGVGSASVGSAIVALTGVAGVNDIEMDAFLTSTRSFIVTNSASQGILSNTSVSGFNGGKAAAAYKTDDYAFSVNGQTPLTDTSVIVPIVTQLLIGAYGSNPGILNGTIKRIAYYPRRLANTELQGITS
jgi:hypothetical protein